MSEKWTREDVRRLAKKIIDGSGPEPEYLTIAEVVGDWADDNGLTYAEADELTELVDEAIGDADVKVSWDD